MKVYSKRLEISQAVAELQQLDKTIGFVPTMGALHKGHASLIDFAFAKGCDKVVISIFVNPTQFNNQEDLEKYPRTLTEDLEFLKPYREKVLIFTPDADQVYGTEVKSRDYNFEGLDKVMEGAFRPGHFEGVATVLSHLFEIVKPDKAFFGEKDFQQLQIIKKLVEIESIPIEIIGAPINRNEHGLAQSSRNVRLSDKQRNAAPFIYKTLKKVRKDFSTKTIEELKAWVKSQFSNHEYLRLEYFEIADPKTLKTASNDQNSADFRAFIAVFAGDVRLIDTLALT
ncbi:MAG: pantoate--beta-alanine ligase [Leeuwenhoekiella sp.]